MVLPGGSTSLTGPTLYSSRVGYLVNKAMEENKRGEPFPIFAICLGHQLLHYVLSGYDKPYRVDISNGVKVLRVLQDVDREAKVYSALSDDLFQVLTTESISMVSIMTSLLPPHLRCRRELLYETPRNCGNLKNNCKEHRQQWNRIYCRNRRYNLPHLDDTVSPREKLI